MHEGKNVNIGALIASLIIIILLSIGGYFSWKNSLTSLHDLPSSEGTTQPVEAIAPPTTPPQESTEITDIAADAASIDLTPLDTGLQNLDLLVK